MLEKGFSIPALFQPALPQNISWFPLPPGWYVLGGGLLIALLIFALFRFARWRRDLWRRQALNAIAQPQNVDSWLALIKRIQLMHQPRATVSHARTPEQLLAQITIDNDLRQQLSEKYCQQDNQLEPDRHARLQSQLKDWLEKLPYV